MTAVGKIETFADLQAAAGDYLNRDDLTVQIPLFIQMAERKITRRVRQKTIRTTLVVSSEATTLPSDCAEIRSMYPRTSSYTRDRAIRIVTPEQLIEERGRRSATGRPLFGSLVEGQLLLAPAPNLSYSLEVTYYEKLEPLSDSIVTNSVLRDNPDVYLWGTLAAAEPYLKNDDRVALWKGMFDEAIDEIDKARANAEYGGSLRPIRLPAVIG